MTLTDAIRASEVQVAEQWHDGYLVQVGEGRDGGYDASVRKGLMPAHAQLDQASLEEAEAWVMQMPLDPAGWMPGESES